MIEIMMRRRALMNQGIPYTITNLVANSGFAGVSGVWPSNWSSNSGASYGSSTGGILRFNTTLNYGGVQNVYVSYTLGHKIYVRAAVAKGATGADEKIILLMFYKNTTWSTQGEISSANVDREIGSNIFTNSTSGVNNIRFGCQNNTTGKTMYLDSPVVVNLTAVFGAGNEPGKAWCDAHIPYFSGTMVVYK